MKFFMMKPPVSGLLFPDPDKVVDCGYQRWQRWPGLSLTDWINWMTRSDPLCFYRAGIQLLVETRGPVFRFSSLPRHWRGLVAGNSRNSKHWSKNKMIEPQCQLNVIHFQFSEVYVFTTFPSPWVSYGFGFPAAKLSVGSSVGWWCCCSVSWVRSLRYLHPWLLHI